MTANRKHGLSVSDPKAYHKLYYQEHKAEQRAKARIRRAQNREKIAAAARQYYAENRERLVKKQRQYYQDNKAEVIKTNRMWAVLNRKKVNEDHRKWVASHPRSPEQVRKYKLARRVRYDQVPREEYLKSIRKTTRAPVNVAKSKNKGGRPRGIEEATLQEAKHLLARMHEWEEKEGTRRGGVVFAARKVYGPTVEPRKAVQRANKTLQKYRKTIIGTKPPA